MLIHFTGKRMHINRIYIPAMSTTRSQLIKWQTSPAACFPLYEPLLAHCHSLVPSLDTLCLPGSDSSIYMTSLCTKMKKSLMRFPSLEHPFSYALLGRGLLFRILISWSLWRVSLVLKDLSCYIHILLIQTGTTGRKK